MGNAWLILPDIGRAVGIEQVNLAAGEMGQVVQQVAANAEETASASKEMTAQAEQMKEFVTNLALLVGGSVSKSENRSGKEREERPPRC